MITRRVMAILVGTALVVAGAASAQAAPSARTAPKTATVTDLRHATDQFHDLTRAENSGYGFFTDAQGIACIDMPGMGGMGVHFVDSALVGDPTEHALHPEAVVYRLDANGKLRLAALLLAARMGLVPQPGRHVRAVQPAGPVLTETRIKF